MRPRFFILLLMLCCLGGKVSVAFPSCGEGEATALCDDAEATRMSLYDALAQDRNAVRTEVGNVASVSSVVAFAQRGRQASSQCRPILPLASARVPGAAKLGRRPADTLDAFPKERHVFRLRRILI